MLLVEQARYPSIQIVPDDNEVYSYGVSLNSAFEQSLLAHKEAELKAEGVITAGRKYPEKFVAGTLHEAFDAYTSHIFKTENKLDATTLKPSQRKRIEYVEVLKLHHSDC